MIVMTLMLWCKVCQRLTQHRVCSDMPAYCKVCATKPTYPRIGDK